MSDVKKRYLEYLNSQEGADKYNQFKKILYGKNDTLVLQLFKIIFPKLNEHKRLEILDVGGGDGKRLIHLMNLFSQKGIETKALLAEPSKTFTQNCKKIVRGKSLEIKVTRKTFEKFQTNQKFDLIIFIHSIYTFRDGQYLKKAKKMLKKNGLLVIVANDKDSFLGGLKKITDEHFHSQRNEVDSLENLLARNKYKFEKKTFVTKFSNVLKGNKLNANGKLVFEWIAMRREKDISKEAKVSAEKYFNQKFKNGLIREKENVILISSK